MMMSLRYWGPVCGYAALIFYLSSQPHPEETLSTLITDVSDKVLHIVEYTVLGGLCYRAIKWGTNESWSQQAMLISILFTSLYGVSDEVHQAFVPFRESSGLDWLADTVGAVLGTMAMYYAMKLWPVTPVSAVVREP